jgi:D-glycero-alpha-D-manno-heptose-7-phosphate kinase
MIISRTPLRISFVGGGTDMDYFYQKFGGSVISASIDKYIYIMVKKRYDNKIVLNYRKRESVDSLDEIKHELIKSALEILNINKSIEILSVADIPSEGSGLGSSSCFTVGVLNALSHYIGEPLNNKKLAEIASEIEIDILGAPIGKQDQYGCAIGGIKQIDFNKDGSVDLIEIPDTNNLYFNVENKLILVNTNKTRSASNLLKKQKADSKKNETKLIKILKNVPAFRDNLISQNFDGVNRLISDYWDQKKKIMSDDKILDLYSSFVPEFCDSGKICGAGGGGYFLFFKKKSSKLQNKEFLNLKIDTKGSVIIYNNYF